MDREEIVNEIQKRIASIAVVCTRNPLDAASNSDFPYAAIFEQDDMVEGKTVRGGVESFTMAFDLTVEIFISPTVEQDAKKGSQSIVQFAKRIKNAILYNIDTVNIEGTPVDAGYHNLGGKCSEISFAGRSQILRAYNNAGAEVFGIGVWFKIKYLER